MKPHFRITPEGGSEPGDKHIAWGDVIEFVDADGNAHDISEIVTNWSTGGEVHRPRKLTLEVFGVEFVSMKHKPPIGTAKWETRSAA